MKGYHPYTVIILCSILVISFWQAYTFYKHSRRKPRQNLDDAKYYELKYQLQFVTSIFPIILAVIGFLGYDYIDSLKVKQKDLEDKYSHLDTVYNKLTEGTEQVGDTIKIYKGTANQLFSDLASVQAQIKSIGNKDIIKQPIYVVSNLIYNEKDEDWRYDFADMKTISGEILPKFSKPPLIIAFSNNAFSATPWNVTVNGFELWNPTYLESGNKGYKRPDKLPFGILIFEQP